MSGLPDPSDVPLLKVDEVVGLVPGMGRSAVYEAVRSGEIPSIRIGSRLFVPTAELRRLWVCAPGPRFSQCCVSDSWRAQLGAAP